MNRLLEPHSQRLNVTQPQPQSKHGYFGKNEGIFWYISILVKQDEHEFLQSERTRLDMREQTLQYEKNPFFFFPDYFGFLKMNLNIEEIFLRLNSFESFRIKIDRLKFMKFDEKKIKWILSSKKIFFFFFLDPNF